MNKTMNTVEALEARSSRRAETNRRRIFILGVFVVAVFVILAALLQIQQNRLQAFLDLQCQQRRTNTIRSNEIWAALGKIEEHNTFVDARIRAERLAVYNEAKLIVPTCP